MAESIHLNSTDEILDRWLRGQSQTQWKVFVFCLACLDPGLWGNEQQSGPVLSGSVCVLWSEGSGKDRDLINLANATDSPDVRRTSNGRQMDVRRTRRLSDVRRTSGGRLSDVWRTSIGRPSDVCTDVRSNGRPTDVRQTCDGSPTDIRRTSGQGI